MENSQKQIMQSSAALSNKCDDSVTGFSRLWFDLPCLNLLFLRLNFFLVFETRIVCINHTPHSKGL